VEKYLEKLPQDFKCLIYYLRELADNKGLPVYIVGGMVRDLLLDFKNLDLDIVVEGDGIGFAEDFARIHRAKLIRHRRFGTATAILKPGLKIDIATARKESYPEPACLPQVIPGILKDDLFRRDFSINAMAIKISGNDFGRLVDLFKGRDDLIGRKIRVLHDLSFVDDPTRILRAARFEKRYNFRIETRTMRLLKEATQKRMLEKVESQRLRDELILSLKEDNPLKLIRRIKTLAGLRFISVNLSFSRKSERLLRNIAREIAWFKKAHTRRRQLDFWLIYFMGVVDCLSAGDVSKVCKKFVFSRGEEKRIIGYKKINRRFILALRQSKVSPADIYTLLEPLSYEVIILLKAKYRNHYLDKHIIDFFEHYNGMRLHVSGDDLNKLGLKPGPRYQKIFKKVLKSRLNGMINTREEELRLIKKMVH